MKIIEKLNKKSGAYCLSAVAKSRDFAFIIDGSLAVNENSASVKWYVANLKMALKKFLLNEEVLPALSKACQYVDERFKKYFEEKTPSMWALEYAGNGKVNYKFCYLIM